MKILQVFIGVAFAGALSVAAYHFGSVDPDGTQARARGVASLFMGETDRQKLIAELAVAAAKARGKNRALLTNCTDARAECKQPRSYARSLLRDAFESVYHLARRAGNGNEDSFAVAVTKSLRRFEDGRGWCDFVQRDRCLLVLECLAATEVEVSLGEADRAWCREHMQWVSDDLMAMAMVPRLCSSERAYTDKEEREDWEMVCQLTPRPTEAGTEDE